jgi:hypothetical protein
MMFNVCRLWYKLNKYFSMFMNIFMKHWMPQEAAILLTHKDLYKEPMSSME